MTPQSRTYSFGLSPTSILPLDPRLINHPPTSPQAKDYPRLKSMLCSSLGLWTHRWSNLQILAISNHGSLISSSKTADFNVESQRWHMHLFELHRCLQAMSDVCFNGSNGANSWSTVKFSIWQFQTTQKAPYFQISKCTFRLKRLYFSVRWPGFFKRRDEDLYNAIKIASPLANFIWSYPHL